MSRSHLVALLLVLAPSTGRAQVEIPLEVADGGKLYLTARIAGQSDVKLMLDTGAGINTLSERAMQLLGASVTKAGTHTGTRHNGETITGPIWSIPSLSLGSLAKRNVIVGQFAPPGADGLLSMDYFRDQPFTIDFVGKRLVIETASHLQEIASKGAVIPIRLKANGPHQLDFFVRICTGNGVAAEAEFDTGAGFNMLMLHPSFMPRLGIVPDNRPRGPLEYYVHSTVLPEMHYCAAPAERSRQQFVGFKEGLIFDALVGPGVFREKRLTIDLPGQRMIAW